MNEQPRSAPEESIIERILSDGEVEAKRVIDNAGRSRRSEERKAEAEAKKVRKDVVGQAEARAATFKSKEVASAQIEAKRMRLRAREEAISKVFATIEQGLSEIRQNTREYSQALRNLAVEAVSAVGGSEVKLRICKEDESIVDDAFVRDVKQGVARAVGSEVTIDRVADPALAGGGCIASTSDGRIIYDNTFRRRLERIKPALRATIVREVLKTDG
jgi:vacuolar-type H+-ATPase subunit E/Vma4